jgi:hypothetical protein
MNKGLTRVPFAAALALSPGWLFLRPRPAINQRQSAIRRPPSLKDSQEEFNLADYKGKVVLPNTGRGAGRAGWNSVCRVENYRDKASRCWAFRWMRKLGGVAYVDRRR